MHMHKDMHMSWINREKGLKKDTSSYAKLQDNAYAQG